MDGLMEKDRWARNGRTDRDTNGQTGKIFTLIERGWNTDGWIQNERNTDGRLSTGREDTDGQREIDRDMDVQRQAETWTERQTETNRLGH